MDFIKKAVGGQNEDSNQSHQQQHNSQSSGSNNTSHGQQQEGGGFLSGLSNKLNSAAGGGKESEKNEDYLDKGIDMFQERVLGQGRQDNESAIEQAKDEKISDFIRSQYKGVTGKDIPIKDKETRFG